LTDPYVIRYSSEATVTGHMLRPSTMPHTAATRSLLSTPAAGRDIPTPCPDIRIPTAAGSIQRFTSRTGLLLPAANG